jgi:acyl carrier protein
MVLEKVKEIISDLFDVDKEEITEETCLCNFGDSFDLAEIIIAVEEEFEIEIPDEEAEKFETVGNIVEYIESNR